MKYILILTLPFYALDQLTKWWVIKTIPVYKPTAVVPGFFELVYVTNNGAAFGSFKNNNTFFIALSVIALVVILVMLLRRHARDGWRDLSLALLLAGVMGNLTDRFWHGHVIDFLLFDLHVLFAHPWPAFNVADSCICVAVFCFIIHSFRSERTKATAANS